MANGLLDGGVNNPLLNIGAGLLSASGWSERPQSLGEGLARGLQLAQGAQGAQAKNEMTRQRILANQRKEKEAAQRAAATKQLQGLLANPQAGNQQKILGLLTQIAPEQAAGVVARQMFPQQRSEPADIRKLKAMGIDPASPEGKKILMQTLEAKGASGEVLKQIQAQIQLMQLEDLRTKRQEAKENTRRAKANLKISMNNDLGKAREMAKLNQRLAGTFYETGLPGTEFRRVLGSGASAIARAFGFDETKSQQLIADYDRFNKLANDFALESIDRLRNTGAITNTKFEALRSSLADIGTSPQANNLVIADTMKTLLDAAEIEGVEIRNADEIRKMIPVLRGQAPKAAPKTQPAKAKPKVINFNDLPG